MKSVKRLAGPAFYVNCDFDDQRLTMNKNERLPNTTKGYGSQSDSALFDVKEGEVLVTYTGTSRRMFKPCGRARVFSALNGIKFDNEKKMMADYKFIGVAQTEHKYVKNPRDRQGLVACVGGVFTITNLSDGTISPGELLYMNPLGVKYRKNRRRGIPENKMVFCLSPRGGVINPQEGTGDNCCPVAKALSYSKPGQRLDILLHPRQPYRPAPLQINNEAKEDVNYRDMM